MVFIDSGRNMRFSAIQKMTATAEMQGEERQKLTEISARVIAAIETGFASLRVPCATHVGEEGVFLRVSGCSIGLRISGSLEEPNFQPFACKAGLNGISAPQ